MPVRRGVVNERRRCHAPTSEGQSSLEEADGADPKRRHSETHPLRTTSGRECAPRMEPASRPGTVSSSHYEEEVWRQKATVTVVKPPPWSPAPELLIEKR
ncbi:unnamed protein product [Heligmosomoides polygyrus]|uniref:Uncharacterized protein n=1 Tax=Heligmosomoides polygyrus TaxID=6339 RepID=A0A183GHZ2_HELPZ|nr:unnamed protein product [Heligmosomoides polygyrus]